jgi:2-polyprenyl-3-methyl-5-hydroxy-6-metoxy-1,4-benzoquinol methylase
MAAVKKAKAKTKSARFDEAYYRRYYEDATTRVHDKTRIATLARAVTNMVAWHGGSLATVLDVGAGAGIWRDWFARHQPRSGYRSIEVSPYACEKYGHELRDISAWCARERFDFIVCQGVLHYIPDQGAAAAIDNLGTMARGFLYLEAITRADFDTVCDQSKTDGDVNLRTAKWYRERLGKHFVNVGCGLYYARRGPLRFYELETA